MGALPLEQRLRKAQSPRVSGPERLISFPRTALPRGAFLLYRTQFPIKEQRILLAGFSACGGSLQRYNPSPPQCDPRGAFLLYRTQFPIKEKKKNPQTVRYYGLGIHSTFTWNCHIFLPVGIIACAKTFFNMLSAI